MVPELRKLKELNLVISYFLAKMTSNFANIALLSNSRIFAEGLAMIH